MQRTDDFAARRAHLAHLSEAALERRFWELAQSITQPLVDMATKHTSPSIERSVILRMGFSSLEAQAIVKRVTELDLLGKGAGHVVWRLAAANQIELKQAAELLQTEAGAEQIKQIFSGGVRQWTS
ncbi:MAG: D-ornithine 4,5-aminomutase subunit alpha [Firmicutes bacterium]|nr:D-ornithine 4,5-aminomutase subunit alpha [Bacillota bacterium]